MSQFAPEDHRGAIDFVSDGDITFEADRDQDGAGDLVFRTGGVERARIDHAGKGTGWGNVLGGSIPASVITYGAVGDGSTDDRAAILTADAAAAAAGVPLAFPAGYTFLVSAGVTLTASLILGPGKIKLSASASSGTTTVTLSTVGARMSGLTIDGTSATNAIGVRPRSSQTYDGNTFTACPAGGIYIDGARTDIQIRGNRFTGGGYGILFDSASTASRVNIVGNTFVGSSTGDAIEVNTPSGGATDITVVGNTISGYSNTSTAGIGIGMAKVVGATISGNDISSCGLDGIHIEDASSAITIANNRVTGCSRAGISCQIGAGVTTAPRDITILGNTVTACCSTAGNGAIALEGGTAVSYCTVSHNIVRANGRAGVACYGIDLGAGGTGNTCVGNEVSNTVGTSSAGIRWNAATDYVVSFNHCWDDQGVPTQEYGLRAYGTNSAVLVIANNLTGNKTGSIDETSITGSSTGYFKRYNRPTGVDNAEILPIVAGAISDTSFGGTVVPNNGALAIDSTNNRVWYKHSNAWNYIPKRSRMEALQAAMGLVTETTPRDVIQAANGLSTQQFRGSVVYLRAGEVVSNIGYLLTTLGTSVTLARVALYDKNGNLKASSVSSTAIVDTTLGMKTVAVSSPFTVPADDYYYVGLIAVFTGTAPQLGRVVNLTGAGDAIGGVKSYVVQSSISDLQDPATFTATGLGFYFNVS